jgi:hypothetical protein
MMTFQAEETGEEGSVTKIRSQFRFEMSCS